MLKKDKKQIIMSKIIDFKIDILDYDNLSEFIDGVMYSLEK